jgi:tetratricopeptide (TPR) repeat protein
MRSGPTFPIPLPRARRRCDRAWRIAAILTAALLAAGVRGDPAPVVERPSPPAPPFVFPARDADLLAFTDAMRAFFAAHVDPATGAETRLRQIVVAILGPNGLHFTYEPDGNYSAAETFRLRRGNCVSFSFLAVAAARAFGLDARFCEVNTYPHWDRHGNVITEIRHLNVHVRADEATFALDLLPQPERDAPVASTEIVSDERAFAHFYNNLAVLRVAAGDATSAQALFDRALAADPDAAFVWANKGAALLRADNLAAAEPCLERAVHLRPAEHEALGCLASLYAATGRARQAAALEKRVRRDQLRNPYYLELLAQGEYDRGQFREANVHLRHAIAIKDDEPDFYRLRILVAQKLGWTRDARRWGEQLEQLRARRPTVHFMP